MCINLNSHLVSPPASFQLMLLIPGTYIPIWEQVYSCDLILCYPFQGAKKRIHMDRNFAATTVKAYLDESRAEPDIGAEE